MTAFATLHGEAAHSKQSIPSFLKTHLSNRPHCLSVSTRTQSQLWFSNRFLSTWISCLKVLLTKDAWPHPQSNCKQNLFWELKQQKHESLLFQPIKTLSTFFSLIPIPVERVIFFLFSLSNTIILDQIFLAPVKTSTLDSLILILPQENLQPGEIREHTYGDIMHGFWKSGSTVPLQTDGENPGLNVEKVRGFQTLCHCAGTNKPCHQIRARLIRTHT